MSNNCKGTDELHNLIYFRVKVLPFRKHGIAVTIGLSKYYDKPITTLDYDCILDYKVMHTAIADKVATSCTGAIMYVEASID